MDKIEKIRGVVHFHDSEDDVKEEGLYYVLNRHLEVCFQTHHQPKILFEERGTHMQGLIVMLKTVLKGDPGQREFLCAHWVERLIEAAKVSIIMIDCYPVHTGRDFRTWIAEEYPHIFLVFVPANCTSIFQVADVGLQRIIKHRLAQLELQWFVNSHTTQIQLGISPSDVEFTKSLPVLRDATVKPIVDSDGHGSPVGRN